MTATIDSGKLQTLLGQMINDMGAAAAAPLVVLGDRLGLYRALADGGPMTTGQLAERTGTAERYVREWCSSQAGYGYITYHPESGLFSMTPEQAAVFADPDSPACMTGGYYSIASMCVDEPKISQAFRTGEGVGWGEHCNCLFCGTEKFFRPGYETYLVQEWLPALDGIVEKLRAGARVADIGCGHGASTLVMARAFPASEFIGLDFHEGSIECAAGHAADAGLENVRFRAASAQAFPAVEGGYDLITFFDCLHDMGDPVGALRHARERLAPGGAAMLVEPFAHDDLKDNLNPVGRMFYAFSTMICTPASMSQEVGLALGAQAGPGRLEAVAREAGFTGFRVAAQTPFNLIIELKA